MREEVKALSGSIVWKSRKLHTLFIDPFFPSVPMPWGFSALSLLECSRGVWDRRPQGQSGPQGSSAHCVRGRGSLCPAPECSPFPDPGGQRSSCSNACSKDGDIEAPVGPRAARPAQRGSITGLYPGLYPVLPPCSGRPCPCGHSDSPAADRSLSCCWSQFLWLRTPSSSRKNPT